MTATRPPEGNPETRNPTMSSYHGITVRDTRKHPATGVCTSINALAFSTLLSSQETDAHLGGTCVPFRGNPQTILRSSFRVNFVSGGFPEGSEATRRSLQTPRGHPPSVWWPLGHTRDLRKLAPRWLPGSRPAFRRSVPSGHVELYDWREAPSNRGLYPPTYRH